VTSTRQFPGVPESVPAARHYVRELLGDAPAETIATIELMVSELVTNCVRHTDSDFELTIDHAPEQIHVEVSDLGAGTPAARSPLPSEPTGRGLRIVETLSGAWGVRPRETQGKTVWFTVETQTTGAR
jgi:serine/threonine-protein kinase RsbW